MHDSFEPWFKDFRKKATILEIRSERGKQSIVPGSILEGEKVEWEKCIEPFLSYWFSTVLFARNNRKVILFVLFYGIHFFLLAVYVLLTFPDSKSSCFCSKSVY